MAALNFPNSPSVNDIHTENGVSFKWNGTIWKKVGASYLDTTNLNVTGIGTFAGNVFINGVLTYEDVKNVDSIGIITARNGINMSGGTATFSGETFFNDKITHKSDTNTSIRFPANDTFSVETAGSERLRITSDGYVRIGGNEGNYPLVVIDESNRTTTADTQLHLYAKHDGSGTTGVGFGGGIRFWGDRASGNVEQNMGRIMCIADVNSGTTLSSAFTFETGVAGVLGEKVRITSAGGVGIGTATPENMDSGARSLVVCGPGGTAGQSGITIASGSNKYGSIYFADGTGSASYRGRVEYRHDNDELLFGAAGAHGDLILDANGDMFLRGDSVCYLVLGSSGDSTQSGANNNMNWIRGNGTNVQYNCAGGFHAWENGGGEKMKLNGANLELTSATQCRLTMGSAGTAGSNDSNWIRGDSNNLMFNCADSSGDHIWEIGGTAYAKLNTAFGMKADNTCKAWLCYRSEAGSEQIQDDFGVASVTDEGTGKFWVNLDNNIHRHGNGFYQSIVFGSYNASPYPIVAAIGYAPSHGSNNPWWDVEDNGFRVNTQRSDTGALLDAKVFSVATFGDTGDLSPT